MIGAGDFAHVIDLIGDVGERGSGTRVRPTPRRELAPLRDGVGGKALSKIRGRASDLRLVVEHCSGDEAGDERHHHDAAIGWKAAQNGIRDVARMTDELA